MSGHTPGPWVAHHGWADEGELSGHPNWCEVTGPDGLAIHGNFGLANARLIASAPMLLEVLQFIHAHGYVNGLDYDRVSKAIEEATGETK